MGRDFRSWKRKLGVVTLLVACVFMAGWVRSQSFFDIVVFPAFYDATDSAILMSWKRGLLLTSRVGAISVPTGCRMLPHLTTFRASNPIARSITDGLAELLDSSFIQWSWKLQGVGYLELVEDDIGSHGVWYLVIPYPAIVTPLILLSAYLFLRKPRVAKAPAKSA
ncbi:hypothetical protein [Schlesneria paludicola]|uniref:hypothetical protein n=1 Tax=Schlesneria paludicola TaxID=360056 RepID=UPI00029B4165|nr:hypothetical protein [Schlesneria paludicola]